MSTIYKYDYMSGKPLQQYGSITEAAKDNNLAYVTVMKQLQQDMLKYPRRDFYFSTYPKDRYVIQVYDNESLELLATYKNVKDAAKGTGVNAQHIAFVCRQNKPLRDRWCGSTSLFFVREVINN